MKNRIQLLIITFVTSMLSSAQTANQTSFVPSFPSMQTDSSLLNVNAPARANTDVHIMGTDAPLYVKRTGAPKFMGLFNDPSTPTYSTITGICESVANANNIGIEGRANGDTSLGTRIGVLGVASNGAYNFGVCGNIGAGSEAGAAVYGRAIASSMNYNVPGHYAGYFDGQVQITDQLTAPILQVNALLGASVGQDTTNSGLMSNNNLHNTISTTRALAALNSYTFTPDQSAMVMATDTNHETTECSISDNMAAYYSRQHHALSADEVMEVYPELVFENADGSHSINYMEIIPILIQAINDLQAEIDELKGTRSPSRPMQAPTQTGIDFTTNDTLKTSDYDLQGRRIKNETGKGVIIRDGKKNIVK